MPKYKQPLTTEVIDEIITTGTIRPKSGKATRDIENEELATELSQQDLLTEFLNED
jgi:hypothetical protein